jgi:hypothetical protein
MRPNNVPVSGDGRTGGYSSRELATRRGAIIVACKCRIRRVLDRVTRKQSELEIVICKKEHLLGCPRALNSALSRWAVIRLPSVVKCGADGV